MLDTFGKDCNSAMAFGDQCTWQQDFVEDDRMSSKHSSFVAAWERLLMPSSNASIRHK